MKEDSFQMKAHNRNMIKIIIALLFVSSCSSLVPQKDSNTATLTKVAVLNFKIRGQQDIKVHLERINHFAAQAQAAGASYLLLPELMVLDMLPVNPPDEKIPEYLEALATLAPDYEKGLKKISVTHQLNLIGASIIVKSNKNLINRSFFISAQGEVQYQDKIQPTPWEVRHNFIGGEKITRFETKDFSFVILICHDAEFPTISAELIDSKPEVIFVPSQTDDIFGLNRVKYTSMARAVEHMSYVLMTGDSGDPEAPWHSYFGQSFFFTPQNKYFKDMEKFGVFNTEELTVFKLDLVTLRKSRQDLKQVYPARDKL